jgi:uncharacterized RDD family membrane protein YckC
VTHGTRGRSNLVRTMDAPNPYAMPRAPYEPPPPPRPQDAVTAGFWIRVAGRLIDSVVSFVTSFLGGGAAGLLLVEAKALGVHLAPAARPLSLGGLGIAFLVTAAGTTGYHTLAEGIGGATVGKLVLGLRVRRSYDLAPCGLSAALIRSVTYYLDALFFGLVAHQAMSSSSSNQRYGDQWAETVVVRGASVPHEPDAGALMAVGLALGVGAEMIAAVLGVLIRRVG